MDKQIDSILQVIQKAQYCIGIADGMGAPDKSIPEGQLKESREQLAKAIQDLIDAKTVFHQIAYDASLALSSIAKTEMTSINEAQNIAKEALAKLHARYKQQIEERGFV